MKGDLGGVVLSTHDRHLVCKHPVGDLDLQISYAAAAEMLVLCQFDFDTGCFGCFNDGLYVTIFSELG